MEKQYPAYYEKLKVLMTNLGEAAPGAMSGFQELHHGAIADGALSAKMKELIALGIAVTVRCDGCIAYHVHDVLEAGLPAMRSRRRSAWRCSWAAGHP